MVGFVALRQNKPAFSGQSLGRAERLAPSLRRATRRSWSQRDQFHHALDAAAPVFFPANGCARPLPLLHCPTLHDFRAS